MLVMSFILSIPASAMDGECDCSDIHSGTTIESLYHAVHHMVEMGHIDAVVSQSLISKLDAATSALNRNQKSTAKNILRAFIEEVNGLSGSQIDPMHSPYIIQHVKNVIAAL